VRLTQHFIGLLWITLTFYNIASIRTIEAISSLSCVKGHYQLNLTFGLVLVVDK